MIKLVYILLVCCVIGANSLRAIGSKDAAGPRID